jgi:hypothetical protein
MLKDQRLVISPKAPIRLLAVSDTHFPFSADEKIKSVIQLAKTLKPTHIWQCGDLYDMYSFSRFARSLDVSTPHQEIMEGKRKAAAMWAALQKAAPSAVCLQSRGNHSLRIVKSLMARAPEFESLMDGPISALTEFPGVTDMKTARSEIVLGDMLLVHGWQSRAGAHADYFGQSVVRGHSHHGGVTYTARKGMPIWELDCGHLADINSLPLSYGESKTNKWVAGCGWVDELGPRFLPL